VGPDRQRGHGCRPKTFARYLRLCARMAGVIDEIELEDALGIASFQVAMGRVPAVNSWVDGLVESQRADAMEGFF